jgi:hypothetical protein
VRDTLLALVLVILSFGVEALHLEDYLWHMHGAFYHWKVLQLGFDLALHWICKYILHAKLLD